MGFFGGQVCLKIHFRLRPIIILLWRLRLVAIVVVLSIILVVVIRVLILIVTVALSRSCGVWVVPAGARIMVIVRLRWLIKCALEEVRHVQLTLLAVCHGGGLCRWLLLLNGMSFDGRSLERGRIGTSLRFESCGHGLEARGRVFQCLVVVVVVVDESSLFRGSLSSRHRWLFDLLVDADKSLRHDRLAWRHRLRFRRLGNVWRRLDDRIFLEVSF